MARESVNTNEIIIDNSDRGSRFRAQKTYDRDLVLTETIGLNSKTLTIKNENLTELIRFVRANFIY